MDAYLVVIDTQESSASVKVHASGAGVQPTLARDPRLLGELLVEAGKITPRDLERALQAQAELGGPVGRVLVKLGLVSEPDLVRILAEQLRVELAGSEVFPQPPMVIEGLSQEFLAANLVIPLRYSEGRLDVAMAMPQDAFLLKAISLATGRTVRPLLATEAAITLAHQPPAEVVDPADDVDGSAADFIEHLRDIASEAPVIRLLNQLITKVVDLGASDIHLEPFDDGLHVRYRVDGQLQAEELVAANLSAAVSSRVKLLAHLDIAERRLPQDGRIKMRVKGRELDLRVSTVPTVYGESLVLRVLDRSSVRLSLADMGFDAAALDQFNALIARPHGILLVTGPTGSGKTTTLYAALAKLDASSQKIITVEDPVEYQLEGINQIQVHPQIGLGFSQALRSILRQDPDIIMIGEMRDGETAQIAVQSALTGHLVLSTLHTNTAASAVIRLRDMGVDDYLITSTVSGVLSQRLVRTLCNACKVAYLPEPAELAHLNAARLPKEQWRFFKAQGCPECRGTGYRGRTAVHELLVLDDDLRRAVLAGQDANSLHALAVQAGMVTLFQAGVEKVVAGITTLEEIAQAAQDTHG